MTRSKRWSSATLVAKQSGKYSIPPLVLGMVVKLDERGRTERAWEARKAHEKRYGVAPPMHRNATNYPKWVHPDIIELGERMSAEAQSAAVERRIRKRKGTK
jgi:hypothetical protein